MTPNRKHMDPSTLELLIMLRTNKDLWDERDLERILRGDNLTDDNNGLEDEI
jgi:hypothetical protein